MLNLKGADNKEWRKLEKKPVRRKNISTDIDANTNKRMLKKIKKDTKQNLRKAEKQREAGFDGFGGVDPNMDEDEGLDSDLTFGSGDDEGALHT